jgi:hypothetical protein
MYAANSISFSTLRFDQEAWPELSDADLALSVKAGWAAIDMLTVQIERLEKLILKRVDLSPQFRMLKTVTGSRRSGRYHPPPERWSWPDRSDRRGVCLLLPMCRR